MLHNIQYFFIILLYNISYNFPFKKNYYWAYDPVPDDRYSSCITRISVAIYLSTLCKTISRKWAKIKYLVLNSAGLMWNETFLLFGEIYEENIGVPIIIAYRIWRKHEELWAKLPQSIVLCLILSTTGQRIWRHSRISQS